MDRRRSPFLRAARCGQAALQRTVELPGGTLLAHHVIVGLASASVRRECPERRDTASAIGVGASGLVALLLALGSADIPISADDVQLRGPPSNQKGEEIPVDATFTVTSWRLANGDGKR